ncbi:MAG TPA: acetate--CoA ligase family protein [Terriglobales bacterium]|nr:acetate--CoA ligase family protein [Terriglobales bacterium]
MVALARMFAPRTVAVIGASRREHSIGGEIVRNLTASGFQGAVYPVNPHATAIHAIPAYTSVEALPTSMDLAIIVTPAPTVVGVARRCIAKGIPGLVVISSGFGETDAAGRQRQQELVSICRRAGVRLIGPNCMGIINTDPLVRLNATFAPQAPLPGNIAFISQSGALGLAILEYAQQLRLGLARFASLGNRADVSSNDLLETWEDDPAVGLVLLYLESFGNPERFATIARRVARRKPVLAIKSGRSRAGLRAAGSHTGALLAADDAAVDALFHQAGVIRADTLEEMFDTAALLAHQPLPPGMRVGIVTNAGGPGILCADACEAEGLTVPALSPATQAALAASLLPGAGLGNPVDMVASAPAAHFCRAIEVVGGSGEVDAVIAIFVPPLVTQPEEAAAAICQGVRSLQRRIPALTVFMSARGVPEALRSQELALPSYAFPESAAHALARVAHYAAWHRTPEETPHRPPEWQPAQARALLAQAPTDEHGWLGPAATRTLLDCYHLPIARQAVAGSLEEAVALADSVAPVVALKALLPGVQHKSDLGAVRLNLRGAAAVRQAGREMEAALRPSHPIAGWLVQEMAPAGVEMILGIVHDPTLGSVVACGAGGVLVELLRDLAVRLPPLGPLAAEAAIRSLKCAPLLDGYRGRTPVNLPALAAAFVNLSWLASDLPEIAELDCNPILVHPGGALIVDARLRLLQPSEAPATPDAAAPPAPDTALHGARG